MNNEKYRKNYIGKCMLSYVEDKNDGIVYMIDMDS